MADCERLEEDEVELSLGLAIGGGGLRRWQREAEKINNQTIPVIGEEIVAVRRREIEVMEAARRRQEARKKQQLRRGGGGCKARNGREVEQAVDLNIVDVERDRKRKKNREKGGILDLNSEDQSGGFGGEVGFDSVVVCDGEVEAEPLVPMHCPVPGMKYVPPVANRSVCFGPFDTPAVNGVGFRPFQGVEKKVLAMENDGADGKGVSRCSSAISENSRLCSQGGSGSDCGSLSSQLKAPGCNAKGATGIHNWVVKEANQSASRNANQPAQDMVPFFVASTPITAAARANLSDPAAQLSPKTHVLGGVDVNVIGNYLVTSKGETAMERSVLPSISIAKMPCVSTTGNGPEGRTVRGFLYRYTKDEVCIVCVCHGYSFSPAKFVEHAGGVDVAHPMRHITVIPSAFR